MADYYSAYTGAQIDALLGKSQFSTNRNLLDNPFFTINQRGVSSWSSGYGVDRWMVSNLSGTAHIADGFWNFSSATGSGQLLQRMQGDVFDTLIGKDVTVTVKRGIVEDSSVYMTATLTVPPKDGSQASAAFSNPIHEETAFLFYSVSGGFWGLQIRFGWTSAYAINVRAVKLEAGSGSSLVYDMIPNEAEELAKCQRYYQIYTSAENRPNDVYDCRPVMRDKSTENTKNTAPTQGQVTVMRGGTAVTYYYNSCDL